MKKILLVLMLALSLTACKKGDIREPCDCKPIIVNENIPTPAVVVKPHDYVADLKPGDSDDKVAKAYVTTYNLWILYGQALERALQPYREAAMKPITKTTTTTTTSTSTTETKKPESKK